MSVSLLGVKAFQEIDWTSLENRPPIDKEKFCTEENWSSPAPCCMDGYSIEHVIDIGHLNGHGDSAALKFLNTYPCLNGVELDHFFESFSTPNTVVPPPLDRSGSGPSSQDQVGLKSVPGTSSGCGGYGLTQRIGRALNWVRSLLGKN